MPGENAAQEHGHVLRAEENAAREHAHALRAAIKWELTFHVADWKELSVNLNLTPLSLVGGTSHT